MSWVVADPAAGGTQSQTVTMALPVFRAGELALFPVVRAPMMDMAGEFPGAYHPEAYEIWQESLRLTALKLHRGGVAQRDILRFLTANSRAPRLFESDLQAMVAACREAGAEIRQTLGRYGEDAVGAALEEVFRYSRRRIERHLQSLPERRLEGRARLSVGAGTELAVHVAGRRIEAGIVLDFEGTSAQVAAPFNVTEGAAKAFAILPLVSPLLDELAINEGMLAPFDIRVPEDSLVNPNFSAATGLGAATTCHMIAASVTAALRAAGVPHEASPALHGYGPQAVLFAPIGTQRENVPSYLAPGFPISARGWGPPGLLGNRRLVSAEELEMREGFRLTARELDDGAAAGMTVRLINDRGPLEANMLVVAEDGGSCGAIRIRGASDTLVEGAQSGVVVAAGDVLEFVYPAVMEVGDGKT